MFYSRRPQTKRPEPSEGGCAGKPGRGAPTGPGPQAGLPAQRAQPRPGTQARAEIRRAGGAGAAAALRPASLRPGRKSPQPWPADSPTRRFLGATSETAAGRAGTWRGPDACAQAKPRKRGSRKHRIQRRAPRPATNRQQLFANEKAESFLRHTTGPIIMSEKRGRG